MAAVKVTVHNNSDQKMTLTLDDTTDAERIEYLQTLKRRDELKDVQVTKVYAQRKTSGDASDVS